ncbi:MULTISPECIES: DUF7115 domain-containing protein [Halolamina]|uniref:DUF7115 domain-containing protein n=1 Tax=Halolamina pelagica TaxID=699431 RepID=A0A1I5R2K8_9EURY|nr:MULTISPECIES: hypothetical protein [Halolamina]NHX35639.1 hypothetical protein [Halolamina sp. R1-12]SFP52276.1 hypothetical protein SAMN05216277_104190 [Halolamina pelagica]
MSLPETVTAHLEGEEPVAEVDLGGEDRLLVTPTRTLVYRAEGLLSDETVEEFPHDAERITLSTSRRKAKLTLDYGLDGEETLSVPKGKFGEVLHPLLAGVLDANGITDAGETVKRTFRFSELTLIVTSKRVVKHIGQAVWDEEFEEYPFENVTDLDFEPGNVATSVVLTHGGRQERFKAPNEDARAVEAAITDALLSYHDVRDIDELRAKYADENAADADTAGESPFGDGPDLFDEGETPVPDAEPEGSAEQEQAPEEPAPTDDDTDGLIEQVEAATADAEPTDLDTDVETDPDVGDLAAEIDDLRGVIEQQQAELERQNDLIEQLIEELRQGR